MESNEYSLAEYNDLSGIETLRSDWWRLLAQTPGATFFMTPEWLETYWRYFGEGQKLVLLTVSRDNRVCGLVPLTIRQEERKVGNVQVLTYPLHDWGSFYGPLASRQELPAVLRAAVQYISQQCVGWDLLDLRWAQPGLVADATRDALTDLDMAYYEEVRAQTAIIDVSGRWEDYLAAQKSKWRNNYRRWIKNLEKLGEVKFVRHRPASDDCGDGDPRWDLYEDCLTVANNSWQALSQDGTTITHQCIAPFLREMHAVASSQGASEMNLLYVGGKPAAFAYNYHFNKSVFGLRIGYDAAMGKAGAGNLLYVRAIEDSFHRDDETYDLGPGTLDCKLSLQPQIVDIKQFTHFAPLGLKAQALRFKHALPAWMAGA